MTEREFQKRYHNYQTHSEADAKAEAEKVNREGVDGNMVTAVEFPPLGWCLMLTTAAASLMEIRIEYGGNE